MILVIDNYDSFVVNIVRYCVELDEQVVMRRNDVGSITDIEALRPDGIIISPGPCGPKDAGLSLNVIKHFWKKTPILGVCLGHQCIGEAFGGKVERAKRPMHGIASTITHDGTGVFAGVPQAFLAGRYHSLIVTIPDEESAPLRVTARSDEGEIMGLAHRHYPVFGVQFHPESILTEHGHQLIGNFLTFVKKETNRVLV
jgi:anthranilate synthase component 2/para-aminobenzoate synthetase component 2